MRKALSTEFYAVFVIKHKGWIHYQCKRVFIKMVHDPTVVSRIMSISSVMAVAYLPPIETFMTSSKLKRSGI